MAFPDLGDTVTVVTAAGQKITGTMTIIRLTTQQAWLATSPSEGHWVPLELIRKKYGK